MTLAPSSHCRREDMRQRFALARLRNFYRDVRTTQNQSTWPPERGDSAAGRQPNANGGGGGSGGPGNADGAGGGSNQVHVQFYDAERAIKTPKPVVRGKGDGATGSVRDVQ